MNRNIAEAIPMDQRRLNRAGKGTLLALLALMSFSLRAQTQPTQGLQVHNIVLVHGAFADGSSWGKIIPLLQKKGFHVTAVHLPFTTFTDDVAAVKHALALEDGPVLLVGHSYAGSVITEAGNDPKVAGLVYVAAFAPDSGQSAGDLNNQYPPPPGAAEIRPDADGFLRLTEKGIAEDFAPDLTNAERQIIAATQGMTSGPNELAAKITTAAWKTKPSFYVVADQDRMIAPELEKQMAARLHARTIHISSSHVVMLSHPAEVAKFILEAAGAQ